MVKTENDVVKPINPLFYKRFVIWGVKLVLPKFKTDYKLKIILNNEGIVATQAKS